MKHASRQRGWILIVVLLLLLALTVVVAGYYAQSEDTMFAAQASRAQQVAYAHAQYGLQKGIRDLRTGALTLSLAGTCDQPNPRNCTAGFFIDQAALSGNNPNPVNNGKVSPDGGVYDLNEGGGLQYEYLVFRRSGDPGLPSNRYVVRSVGYYGFRLDAPNLVTTILEAEIDIGNPSGFNCQNDYECGK